MHSPHIVTSYLFNDVIYLAAYLNFNGYIAWQHNQRNVI